MAYNSKLGGGGRGGIGAKLTLDGEEGQSLHSAERKEERTGKQERLCRSGSGNVRYFSRIVAINMDGHRDYHIE